MFQDFKVILRVKMKLIQTFPPLTTFYPVVFSFFPSTFLDICLCVNESVRMREPGMFLRMSVISSATQQLSSLPPLELSRNLCEVSQLCGLVYQRFLKPLPPNNEDKKEFPLADPRHKFKLFSCTNSSYLLVQRRQTRQQ